MAEHPSFTHSQLAGMRASRRAINVVHAATKEHTPFLGSNNDGNADGLDRLLTDGDFAFRDLPTQPAKPGNAQGVCALLGYFGKKEIEPFSERGDTAFRHAEAHTLYQQLHVTYAGLVEFSTLPHRESDHYAMWSIEQPEDPVIHGLGVIIASHQVVHEYLMEVAPGSDMATVVDSAAERLADLTETTDPEQAEAMRQAPRQTAIPTTSWENTDGYHLLDAAGANALADRILAAQAYERALGN